VPLFRRREPLHERLAREGGLNPAPLPEPGPQRDAEGGPVSRPGGSGFAGAASSPAWMETGVHGVPQARRWDTVVTVEAEGVEGDTARFVAVDGDTLVVEEGGDVEALAAALDDVVQTPYRAEAQRRSETQWAVGIHKIRLVQLPDDPEGEEVTLTVAGGERTLTVDGAPAFGSIPELERLGGDRSDVVVQARRLEGSLWEVEVLPL
jgi:hypothetical protein